MFAICTLLAIVHWPACSLVNVAFSEPSPSSHSCQCLLSSRSVFDLFQPPSCGAEFVCCGVCEAAVDQRKATKEGRYAERGGAWTEGTCAAK